MERWQRRAAKTIGGLVVLTLVASVAYHYVMIVFEGRTASYVHSTQVVVETFTGTGYGSDSPWESPVANLFVIALDMSTFLILFIVLPYVFQPILEERLSPTPPQSTTQSDHVVLACEVTSHVERLVDEFEARSVEYVVLAENERAILDLMEDGAAVVHGDPTSAAALQRANVARAAAVVVAVEDAHAPSSVLAIRERAPDVLVVAQCQDPSLERSLEHAGADRVMLPRQLLGRRLADRVRSELDPRVSDVVSLGEEFAVVEATIDEESPIHGSTIAESGLLENEAVTMVGVWVDDDFVRDPAPETRLDRSVTLILAGVKSELRQVEARTRPGSRADGSVVIAGFGEVGSAVHDRLTNVGFDCTVVDLQQDAADVVGDATDEETLREAGVENAEAFVVALADDDDAVLAVLHARALQEGLHIAARMNERHTKSKARRAGADYVLAVPDIAGRLVALNVLREAVLSYDRQVEIVSVDAEELPGRSLDGLSVQELGCLLVAVERDGTFLTDVPIESTLEPGDSVLIAGNDEAIDALRSTLD
ncbi:potassium channel family protein [Halorubrum sp. DTA98]|uniref:potassium channel family protein n=1 Tax=Halorubrum sp. DTA98 TaxID=3402163 RepID=UPI003AAD29BB